jgi:hypothetical protein
MDPAEVKFPYRGPDSVVFDVVLAARGCFK